MPANQTMIVAEEPWRYIVKEGPSQAEKLGRKGRQQKQLKKKSRKGWCYEQNQKEEETS